MNPRFMTLAGAVGALFIGSSALAAPPSSPCKVPELAKRDMKGIKVGNWQALAAKIGSDGQGTNETEAIASVCKYRECSSATSVICVAESETACYVKDAAGVWFAYPDVFEVFEASIESRLSTSADGRYLNVALVSEVLGRIEDAMCEEDEDGNVECMSATGSFGWEYANLVIDTKTMTLAFDGRFSDSDPEATGNLHCKGKPSVSFASDAFVYEDCVGKKTTVTLADLGPCTVAARTKWNDAMNTARSAAETAKGQATTASATAKIDAGRKATAAKKYDDAIAAFDAAIKISPYIAKAHSGRGYARLLREGPGDLDAAKKDFQRALEEETGDMKFRASVHFNLGLIAEKEKKPAEAKAWFKKAHGQNPSAATKKKLGL